jgi:two-component system OmpR family response regulator
MGPKKVVIIDDEIDLCHLLRTYLTDLEYEVHIAHTLNSGLQLLTTITPDILFVDNNLPDGLGWENLKFFETKFPLCRINLISAYDAIPVQLSKNDRIRIIEKPLRLNAIRDYL